MDGLGAVAFLRGDYTLAQRYFVQAYQSAPDYSEALANLARLYEAMGYDQQAQLLYLRAIAENPADFRARNNLAGYIYTHGSVDALPRAHQELLKAQALSDHPLIESNLSKVE